MTERPTSLRVGTWNLQGKWSARHAGLLTKAACHVWLLTEVPVRAQLEGYALHPSGALMTDNRRWAVVAVQDVLSATQRPADPHPASVAVDVEGTTFCASVLPWRSCGTGAPWRGRNVAAKTEATTHALIKDLPPGNTVWGGDWNHSFVGRETAGSLAGREVILEALKKLEVSLATADLPHRTPGRFTIDHIAVPADADVTRAYRLPALTQSSWLSDHDAYVVEFALPHRFSVYVIEVLGGHDKEVYVGQSWHAPSVRRQKHVDGPDRGRIFARPGRSVGPLRPELLPRLGPLMTREAARAAEEDVKTLLRGQGYTVHGNA